MKIEKIIGGSDRLFLRIKNKKEFKNIYLLPKEKF